MKCHSLAVAVEPLRCVAMIRSQLKLMEDCFESLDESEEENE